MQFPNQKNYLPQSISLLCAGYTGEEDFYEKFRALARQCDGVEDVVMLAAGSPAPEAGAGNRFITLPLHVLDEVVGELQVYVRAEQRQKSGALPAATYLARQLETALRASALHSSNTALKAQLEDLVCEVQEHKLFERARGIIESQRLIPAGQGARLLKKVSARSGKNLRQLATGILSAAEKNPWRFRKEFYV